MRGTTPNSAALLVALALAGPAEAEVRPEAAQARALLEAGRHDAATRLLIGWLREDGQAADGWLLLGAAHEGAGRLPEARESYRRHLALRPNSADGHVRLAWLLDRQGERAGAAAAYRTYLARESRPGQRGVVEWARGRLAALAPQLPAPPATVAPGPARPPDGRETEPGGPNVATIGIQVATGVAGGLAGGAIGGSIGLGAGLALEEDCRSAADEADTAACIAIAVLPFTLASIGAIAGIPVGVWTGGELRRAGGGGWATLAGGVIGASLGVSLAAVVRAPIDSNDIVDPQALRYMALWGTTGSLLGSIVGYQLSTAPPTRSSPR